MRPVPTKWETSHKLSFPRYNQIHIAQTLSFKMIHYMSGLLAYSRSKIHYFLEKFLCFLLIFKMFNEPYLLEFTGNLSLILWEQVSNSFDTYFWRHSWLTSGLRSILYTTAPKAYGPASPQRNVLRLPLRLRNAPLRFSWALMRNSWFLRTLNKWKYSKAIPEEMK